MLFPFFICIAARSRLLGNFSIFLCWILPICPRVVCAAFPLAIISANEPFLSALGASFIGGGVGWPFLNVDVAEFRITDWLFWTTLAFDTEESVAENLLGWINGFEQLATCRPLFCDFSTGLRRSSSAFLFGGGEAIVEGLGSPVIEARRSPIFVMMLDAWFMVES